MHRFNAYESFIYSCVIFKRFTGTVTLLFGIPIKRNYDLKKSMNTKVTNTSYKIFNFPTLLKYGFARYVNIIY